MTAPLVNAWSFSRWTNYDDCPAQFKYRHLDKLPEEKGVALLRGARIAEEAEKYLKGELTDLPESLRLYRSEFNELKAENACAEEMWAFDRAWQPIADQKADFDKIWLRVKVDAWAARDNGVLRIIDFKTGKVKRPGLDSRYDAQLELYAIGGDAYMRDVHAILVELWYLDHHVTTKRLYKAEQIPPLRAAWNRRIEALMTDTEFKPKPSTFACAWCPYSKAKGGPCRY